jgi:hypothetical protein
MTCECGHSEATHAGELWTGEANRGPCDAIVIVIGPVVDRGEKCGCRRFRARPSPSSDTEAWR